MPARLRKNRTVYEAITIGKIALSRRKDLIYIGDGVFLSYKKKRQVIYPSDRAIAYLKEARADGLNKETYKFLIEQFTEYAAEKERTLDKDLQSLTIYQIRCRPLHRSVLINSEKKTICAEIPDDHYIEGESHRCQCCECAKIIFSEDSPILM